MLDFATAKTAGCGKTPLLLMASRTLVTGNTSQLQPDREYKLIFGFHWLNGNMNNVAPGFYGLCALADSRPSLLLRMALMLAGRIMRVLTLPLWIRSSSRFRIVSVLIRHSDLLRDLATSVLCRTYLLATGQVSNRGV